MTSPERATPVMPDSGSAAATEEPRRRRRTFDAPSAVLLALVAVLILVTRAPTLRQPLLEAHDFRQTQTAYTSMLFHSDGVDLIHPELPVLGEPWEVPFEFPAFQATAAAAMSLGIGPDAAMRVTALAWFMITALLVWATVRHVTKAAFAAGAAVVAFAFSPFSLLWSRASTIEFAATAGAVGWAYFALRWLDSGKKGWALLSLGAGTLGMLVKPTTAAFWVLPIAAWALRSSPSEEAATEARVKRLVAKWRRLARPTLLVLVVVPIALALVWTSHADAIKAASRYTEWLTSESLKTWNLGTLEQRLQASNWLVISDRAEPFVLGRWFGLPLALAGLLTARPRTFWWAIFGTAVLPIAVFFNLYVVHDYYLSAVTPSAAMLLGVGAAWVHQQWRRVMPAVVAALLLGAVWAGAGLLTTRSYWELAYRDPRPNEQLTIATELYALTAADDRIALVGLDWSPTTLYYANRRGTMLKAHLESPQTAAELAARGYEVFALRDPLTNPLELIAAWEWFGAIGPHTYLVGSSPHDVAPATVLGSYRAVSPDGLPPGGEHLTTDAIRIECGTPTDIPASPSGPTWVLFGEAAEPGARILVGSSPAPLPAAPVIVVTQPTSTSISIDCVGAEHLIVRSVLAAPLDG